MSKSYSVSIPIPKEGIITYYCNKGFNDVIFVVEEEEIFGVSLFLKEKNVVLKKMIEDENREEKIQIEKVSKIGFISLLQYYGYGKIELDESNIFDILMVCVCYNEMILLEECKKYIIKNSNIKLIQRMFNEIPMTKYDPLKDIELKLSDYLSIYGNELFKDENINNNNIDLLKYVLSMNNFVIKSENYLYNQLKKLDNGNDKNEMIELYKKINMDELEEKEKNELIEILKENGENEMKEEDLNRLYIDNEPTNNEIFNKWFYFYCLKHGTKNRLLEEESYYKYQLSLLDLQSFISRLLNSKIVLTLSNTVDLINDYKLEYDTECMIYINIKLIVKFTYRSILKVVSSKYILIQKRMKRIEEENKNNVMEEEKEEIAEARDENEMENKPKKLNILQTQKNSIIKSLLLFCNNIDLIPLIKYECNDENIFNNFNQFFPKYNSFCNGLFIYFKSKNQCQSNESTVISPPSYFRYPKDEYCTSVFHLPLIIKSEFIGEKCEFINKYYYNSNIVCDKLTGDLTINGILNDNTYTVTCKNKIGSISTKIKLEVIDIGEGYRSDNQITYNPQNHRVDFNTNGYFVFNKEFYKGIYEIKCNTNRVSIGACTTRNNQNERYYRGNNKSYDIINKCSGNYTILFDLKNKQLGYRKEDEKEMTIVKRNTDSSFYLVLYGSNSSYFEIEGIERIK